MLHDMWRNHKNNHLEIEIAIFHIAFILVNVDDEEIERVCTKNVKKKHKEARNNKKNIPQLFS